MSEPVLVENSVDEKQFAEELAKYYSGHKENTIKSEWTSERIRKVIKIIEDYNLAKNLKRRATSQQYHHGNKYDVMTIGHQRILIIKRKTDSEPIVQIIPSSDYYSKLLQTHIETGHGRRDKMVHALRDKFMIPIIAICIFLKLCKTCLTKKSFPKTGIVVKPIISNNFNSRGQVDLMDFQTNPDKEYKWLMQYQDHLTKFCFLRPLKTKEAKEVAIELLKIFLEVGCPTILQSDNGREFTASVLKEIISLWPICKIVNGRPRYPQSQGSIERSNQDVKNMIRAWMVDNRSNNWSIGCYFAQFQKNSSYHSTIARTPYKALFGHDPRLGLTSTHLTHNIISKLDTEEELEVILSDISKSDQDIVSAETQECEEFSWHNQMIENSSSEMPEQNLPVFDSKIDFVEQHSVTNNFKTPPNVPGNTIIIEEINTPIEILTCHICNTEASGAHKCVKCKSVVHVICGVPLNGDEGYGSPVICNLCLCEKKIEQERWESHIHLKKAAEKMTAQSTKKFKEIDVDATVLVEVPKVDRLPLDGKNIVGKVLEKRNELYRVGTPVGIINDWLPRNAVLLSPGATLSNDIPEISLPLRTISSMSSSFGGQGMKQCNCKKLAKGQCISNKCACKKANILCNSRCHKSLSCQNK